MAPPREPSQAVGMEVGTWVSASLRTINCPCTRGHARQPAQLSACTQAPLPAWVGGGGAAAAQATREQASHSMSKASASLMQASRTGAPSTLASMSCPHAAPPPTSTRARAALAAYTTATANNFAAAACAHALRRGTPQCKQAAAQPWSNPFLITARRGGVNTTNVGRRSRAWLTHTLHRVTSAALHSVWVRRCHAERLAYKDSMHASERERLISPMGP